MWGSFLLSDEQRVHWLAMIAIAVAMAILANSDAGGEGDASVSLLNKQLGPPPLPPLGRGGRMLYILAESKLSLA